MKQKINDSLLNDTSNVELIKTISPQDNILSIYDLLFSGGNAGIVIIIILLLISFLTFYIFFERFLFIKKSTKLEYQFLNKVKDYLNENKFESIIYLCNKSESSLSNVIKKGVKKIDNDTKKIQDAMEFEANLEVYKLEKNLSYLATFSSISPMIGFLGTVIGMIIAFHEMASSEGQINLEMLSKGIYMAMTTTVVGLVVGIIANIFYNQLISKVQNVIFLMEKIISDFLQIISETHKK